MTSGNIIFKYVDPVYIEQNTVYAPFDIDENGEYIMKIAPASIELFIITMKALGHDITLERYREDIPAAETEDIPAVSSFSTSFDIMPTVECMSNESEDKSVYYIDKIETKEIGSNVMHTVKICESEFTFYESEETPNKIIRISHIGKEPLNLKINILEDSDKANKLYLSQTDFSKIKNNIND